MTELPAAEPPSIGIKGEVTILEPDQRERAIARRSAETRAIVPNVEYATHVDMESAVAREAALGIGLTALLIHAAARALRAVPRLNAAYRDGHLELYSRTNIALRLLEEGIHAAPVLSDAEAKPAEEIARELADLTTRAREGTLSPAEVSGATFTITDSGALGVATLTPLIVPPQAAALAAGPVREAPVVRHGRVVAGHTMMLTLACDHRIVHGFHAAVFLEKIKAHLEEAMP